MLGKVWVKYLLTFLLMVASVYDPVGFFFQSGTGKDEQ